MPDVTLVNLNQKAVLWAYTGLDRYGQPKVQATADAVEISCRWEEKVSEQVQPDGTVKLFTDTVFVDRVIAEQSVMRLGKKTDLPDTLDNLRQVLSYDEVPDLKGTKPRRLVMLGKYQSELNT